MLDNSSMKIITYDFFQRTFNSYNMKSDANIFIEILQILERKIN